MEASAWRAARPHFDAARELADAQREHYLAALEDTALRADVRALLAADDAPSALLDAGPFRGVPQAAGDRVGGTLDGWRLMREIGEGGTSVVFEGRRTDANAPPVAVKVLKRGFGLSSVPARFRRERAVLDALHAAGGVPRVLGAGELADGRPYLVTELVEGVPIDVHTASLPLRARLERFVDLCAIVHEAHRHLVVHRDLKPSNVLVTPAGDVHVLDFGLAKLLEPDGEAEWTQRFGPAPRTPGYASPEQTAGAPATTASDVYSLGVLLFRLATGGLPYAAPPTDRDALEREVLENGTSARRLAASVSQDLVAIVELATARDPGKRYASARHLAEDVRRWIAHRPVRAREWHPLERGLNAMRRRPLASAAIVGAIALALGSWLGTVRSLERVRHSESLAWRAHAQAVRSTNLLADLLDELGDRGPGDVGTLLRERLLAAEATLADLDGAEAEARLRLALGRAFHTLGDGERAERHARRALELSRNTVGLGWRDTDRALALLAAVLEDRADPSAADVEREREKLRARRP